MRYELRAVGVSYAFQFEPPAVEGYVIGRSDESNAFKPDIDLALADARTKGISRRHAAIVRYQGAMHLLDLESVNGTYVNDNRLKPNIPHPLQAGDEVRFGSLHLRVLQVK
ncbi:MAG: FHA domain-containing protein [Chloroflexota bacterium]|nr:FHA domain-containing protein [Chloroflexota bacterium]